MDSGKLYVVATPIGNLEDITYRAVRVLTEVSLIAAEDTRVTQKLLRHFNIQTPVKSYYKDRETKQAHEFIAILEDGRDLGLVSDAGTPAVSDPGQILVELCHVRGIQVIPIPGPSAVVSLVSCSGLCKDGFSFIGFLPSKKSAKIKILQPFLQEKCGFVFYDSPRRILKTLAVCAELFTSRRFCLGRELTKLHEEINVGTAQELFDLYDSRQSIKGEFVVVVDGDASNELCLDDSSALLELLKEQGYTMKDAVKKISKDLGLTKSAVYEDGLRVWGKK
jgi:16S rRNA (cytidine1402-2'-O)-methyltransferase